MTVTEEALTQIKEAAVSNLLVIKKSKTKDTKINKFRERSDNERTIILRDSEFQIFRCHDKFKTFDK